MKTQERISQFRKICAPFNKAFTLLTLLVLGTQCTYLFAAYATGELVDSLDTKDTTRLIWGLGGITASLVINQVCQWLLSRCHINDIVFDLEVHVSKVTLERISRFSIGQVVNQNSGFSQETLKKGESAIAELAYTLFLEVIPSVIRVLTTTIALFFLNFWIGLVATVSIALFVIISFRINKKTLPRIRKNRKMETKISTAYWEVIKHLRLVISSAQEKRTVREYSDRYHPYSEDGKNIWVTYVIQVFLGREPFAIIGQMSMYAIGVYLVWHGQSTKGDFIVMMGWTTIAFNALGNVGNMQRRIARNFALVGKYFDLLDIPPAVVVKPGALKLNHLSQGIEFKDVSFMYPEYTGEKDDDEDEKPKEERMTALQNISVTINTGEIVALVGPSGSGKSTFIQLLQRGYDPDSGSITVDGHDLRDIDIGSLREMIGLVDQDPKLWDETLRYNIVYGLNGSGANVTEAELDQIARDTRIDEFFHRLGPKKYETLIGEGGVLLSGGQRQRVAIARALMKNPKLLILDEATNALDTKNEKLVHAAICKALVGRTGIIIAHRLSTIRHADKIIVFEKGKIVGVGSDSELMQTCESYRDLVEYEREALRV
ncbi:MAG: hypothetical protein RLZZ67_188 [Candidatus Parcubacteria bacterium]|jgi:ABC-type multidrug transport system fused ATPase/permease subunit